MARGVRGARGVMASHIFGRCNMFSIGLHNTFLLIKIVKEMAKVYQNDVFLGRVGVIDGELV